MADATETEQTTRFRGAVEKGLLDTLRTLQEDGFSPAPRDMVWAVRRSDESVVRTCLMLWYKPPAAPVPMCPVLDAAIAIDSTTAVQIILLAEGSHCANTPRNTIGWLPIHFAIIHDAQRVVAALLQPPFASKQRATTTDISALRLAVLSGNKRIIDILTRDGIDASEHPELLFAAIIAGRTDMILRLIALAENDAGVFRGKDHVAMQTAVAMNRPDAVALLAKRIPVPTVQHALETGADRVLEYLLSTHPQCLMDAITQRRALSHFITRNQTTDPIRCLDILRAYDLLGDDLKPVLDHCRRRGFARTLAVHDAARINEPFTVDGASHTSTVLTSCVAAGDVIGVMCALRNGADPHLPDGLGRIPLAIYASAKVHADIGTWLIAYAYPQQPTQRAAAP